MNPNGLPVVAVEHCTACGDCVRACPRGLFELMPLSHHLIVQCRAPLKGELAVSLCTTACDACGRCAADAAPGLIRMEDNLPVVDYGAGGPARPEATYRCPTRAIEWVVGPQFQEGAPPLSRARLLLTQESQPLAEIVRVTNKYSSNMMARSLVLAIAAEKSGTPATTAAGEAAIREWLASRGLDFPELVIGNGSGLSREARIAGDSMARMLVGAWKSRYGPEFLASLSLGGLDGTLEQRFRDVNDPCRIRMKTGTLNGVSSLAGYVTGRSGRTYATVIMVNNPGAQYGPGESIQRAVIDWVLDQ